MNIETVAELKACLDDGRAASLEKIMIDGAEAGEAAASVSGDDVTAVITALASS